ncbi:VCBS repeat-containing protein, partial [Myxococcota bacterium]|nr:VCBS repeat-containing protein [Myxococcota bacterium]
PPTCAILAPPPEDDGLVLATETVTLTVRVTDPDTPPDRLTVSLNGQVLTLAADNTATVDLPLAEGANAFILEGRDPEGQRCMARRQLVGDRTGPTMEVTAGDGAPIGNELQTGDSPLVLRIAADDPHGMTTVEATARGLPVAEIDGPQDGVWTAEIILSDGTNPITVTAIDALGNQTDRALSVFFDGQAPELALSFPIDGQLVEANTIDVRGTVTDNLDVTAVRLTAEVTAPGQRPAMVPLQRPDPDGAFRFAAVPLYNGDNTITVTARDAVRSSTAAVHLRVEPGAPVVDITEPDPAVRLITGQPVVHLEGSASRSVTEVDVGPQGNPVTVVPEDGVWTADIRLPAQGTYELSAVGRTPGGRTSAPATLTVLYDDSPPVIRITSPADGFCTAAQMIQVEGDAVDIETRVPTVTVNGTPFAVQAGTNRFRGDVAVMAGLDQRLVARGENAARIPGETSIGFSVDRTGPILALALQQDQWVAADEAGNIEIRGTVSDAGCGLAPVPLLVNAVPTLTTPEGEFVTRQNRGLNPHITVVASDVVGNQTRREIDVRVDAEPPTITEVDPEADLAIGGVNLRVSAVVADAQSGLASVSISGAPAQLQNGRYFRDVALIPGPNPIAIVARDNVGLERTHTVNINRDVTAPSVTITSPVANAFVEDKLIIEGTTADNDDGSGVATVTVNNVPVTPDENGRWRHVGLAMLAGQQNISVFATDNAGNRSPVSALTVTVRDFAFTASTLNGLDGAAHTRFLGRADVNADGRLDLIALTDHPDGINRIFTQQANGTFVGQAVSAFGLPDDLRVNDAGLADFNGDGLVDLIVAAPAGASTAYLGDRAQGFVRSIDPGFPVAGDATGLALGDIDRDGFLDLLFVAGADSTVRFGALGGGAVPATLVDIGSPDLTGMTQALLVDLDTDGVAELIVSGPGGARAHHGELDGTFTDYADGAIDFGSTPASHLFALDADRDRDLDVITVGASHAVHATGLAAAAVTEFTTGALGLTATAGDRKGAGADLDGDAREDVVVFGDAGITVFGGGAAGFALRDLAALGLVGVPAATTGAVTDIDGDGDHDILVGGPAGVALLRSNVTTTRAPAYTYMRVLAYRALNGESPRDAIGTVVFVDLQGANPAASRAIVHPATGPLVVTFGGAARVDLEIQWTERDGGSENLTTVPAQRPQAAGANPVVRSPLE